MTEKHHLVLASPLQTLVIRASDDGSVSIWTIGENFNANDLSTILESDARVILSPNQAKAAAYTLLDMVGIGGD